MIQHGENVIVKVGGSTIAASKSCSIDVTADTTKVADASDGAWEHIRPGRKAWTLTTNHLVTDIHGAAEMVGEEVDIDIQSVRTSDNDGAIEFGGVVPLASVLQNSTTLSGTIVYVASAAKFAKRVLVSGTYKYYLSWSGVTDDYLSPTTGAIYCNTATGVLYRWNGSSLVALTLSGSAVVKVWRGTFTRGNLAQGSFVFEGSGPLE